MKNYGKTEEEHHYEKMGKCREIVKEILNFGVTEKQKSQIIYLLSLEIEDRELMIRIKDAIEFQKSEKKESEKKLISI